MGRDSHMKYSLRQALHEAQILRIVECADLFRNYKKNLE